MKCNNCGTDFSDNTCPFCGIELEAGNCPTCGFEPSGDTCPVCGSALSGDSDPVCSLDAANENDSADDIVLSGDSDPVCSLDAANENGSADGRIFAISAENANIPVVNLLSERKRKKAKMQKIVIVIIVLVIIAAAVAVAVIAAKSKNSKNGGDQADTAEVAGDELSSDEEADTSPVTFNEDVSVSFEGISLDYADALSDYSSQASDVEALKQELSAAFSQAQKQQSASTTKKQQVTPQQHLEETTIKTSKPAGASNKAKKVIAAFFSGEYYFDGEMISGGEKMPLEMAMKGSDYEVFTEMEDTDIAIMNLDGKLYLLNPGTKKYAEVNAAVKKVVGISDDMFSFDFNKIKMDAYAPTSVTQAEYKGQPAVCYSYKDTDKQLEFIVVNDDVKQMTLYNSGGTADAVLVADEFSAEIPAEMFNFKGYSKTNIISFMSSLM